MVTTVLELVGSVTVAAGVGLLVLVFIPWLWPITFVVFGAGLIGVSALFSWFSVRKGR